MFYMLFQRNGLSPRCCSLPLFFGNVGYRCRQTQVHKPFPVLISSWYTSVTCCVCLAHMMWTFARLCVFTVCPIEFPMILRDSLEVLYLNDNQLECVPLSVCGLHSLTELYLSKWVPQSVCQSVCQPVSPCPPSVTLVILKYFDKSHTHPQICGFSSLSLENAVWETLQVQSLMFLRGHPCLCHWSR